MREKYMCLYYVHITMYDKFGKVKMWEIKLYVLVWIILNIIILIIYVSLPYIKFYIHTHMYSELFNSIETFCIQIIIFVLTFEKKVLNFFTSSNIIKIKTEIYWIKLDDKEKYVSGLR